jgi:hypothetical protein
MSLISYASPWTSEHSDRNDNGTSRKRTPTIGRKTIKVRPNHDLSSDQYETYSSTEVPEEQKVNIRGSQHPETIDDHIEKQTDRNTKINSILSKITSFSTDDKLGDFNPMPYPTTITKKNADQILPDEKQNHNGENPLMPKTGKPVFESSPEHIKPAYYRASDPNPSSQYASYRDAYGKEGLTGKREPYYSKMGIAKGGDLTGDKVMDRLNYMSQMLESLQMEKTNHVTEEFVLYSLLGVFMIYIVDGFSRGGKYIR